MVTSWWVLTCLLFRFENITAALISLFTEGRSKDKNWLGTFHCIAFYFRARRSKMSYFIWLSSVQLIPCLFASISTDQRWIAACRWNFFFNGKERRCCREPCDWRRRCSCNTCWGWGGEILLCCSWHVLYFPSSYTVEFFNTHSFVYMHNSKENIVHWDSILKNKVSLPPDGVSDVVILVAYL